MEREKEKGVLLPVDLLVVRKNKDMQTRWIVTREINEYDQDGEYFVGVFDDKPVFKELSDMLPEENNTTIGKLTRGGGRQGTEREWFHLTEIEVGKNTTSL